MFLDYDSMHQEDASVDRLWDGGKKGVLPVFVLCHCYDGEEVIDTTYLDDERGQRWLYPIILVMFIVTVL